MLNKLYNLYKDNYHFLYVVFLSIFVINMPHFRGLLSSSQIALAAFWILDVNFIKKIKKGFKNKALLLFLSIFSLHIIGLLYTNNFSYALKDLRVKLPLLLFPLVIATSDKLSFKEIKLLLTLFSISIFLKTLYGLGLIFEITGKGISSLQEISGRMSHIRFSLLLNIIAFVNFYYLVISEKYLEKKIYIVLRVLLIIWMLTFVFILHSVTGWVVFLILLVFTGFFVSRKRHLKYRKLSALFSLIMSVVIVFYIIFSINKFYKTDKIDKNRISMETLSGNKYKHNFKSNNRENGHFVDLYFCKKELSKTWNKVSKVKYTGKDKKNQSIRNTLKRYLTSKNYRKDREGVLQLSRKDISNIEDGMANYIYENKFSVYPKIYEVLWQIDMYMKGGNPQRHSVTQRFEFLKIANKIIKENFWFGVGTGDVGDVFTAEYEKSNSKLKKPYRLRAHNQYVTFFITFGFVGFIWFLFAYIYPAIIERKFSSYLFLIAFITISLSMINEDTTETQMGATIFAFFLSFFLFTNSEILDKKKTAKN